MKRKTLEELAEETVDNALSNVEISGVHFREFALSMMIWALLQGISMCR